MRPSGLTIAGVLLLGILAISFGSILVRLALAASGEKGLAFSLVMSAGRMGFAALLLLPGWRRPLGGRAGLPWAVAAGVALALHFAFWITSLSYTSVAASTALVTTNPVWVTLFGWLLFGDKPTGLTLLGVGVALLGGLLIGLGDAHGGAENPPLGNLLAVLGALATSFYFLLGREAQRRGLSLLEYVRVAYTAAFLTLLPLPYLFGGAYGGHPPVVYLYILLMALLPQLVGHTSFNWATRHVSPVLVTLAILFEPVGAGLLAFLLFGELPGLQVLLGALVLLLGVGLAVLGGRR
ncbi:DMT family transporter [Thermus sediminis]|uniref:DMT family transporter n=1 Tax=Thermus sediminis TaxID=1761908 RepID=UPI000E3D911C|nr:DMT family transporter [Thermus sediminis]